MFGLIDGDAGGSIDKDEFYDLLCLVKPPREVTLNGARQVGLGDSLPKEDADAMIDKVDVDGSGEVELDEFLQVVRYLCDRRMNDGAPLF